MSGKYLWISKDAWAEVWSAIHNIRVRKSFTVLTPGVSFSGSGASARINIDLPSDSPADGGGGGDGAVPAAITGGSSAAGYSVDLYADGYGKPKTGSGTLYLTEVAYNSDLPSGARVLAHPCLVETTAGDAI